jgi:hypothetical protein
MPGMAATGAFRFDCLREIALSYAFAIAAVGETLPGM